MWTSSIFLAIYLGSRINSVSIDLGRDCNKRNGVKGICTHFTKCASAIREVQKNGRPEICSFDGRYPIVCCAESSAQTAKLTKIDDNDASFMYLPFDENIKRLKKCRDYHPKEWTLPPNTFAYIGGRNSLSKEYPHMAVLGYGDENNIQWQCGGSLISEEYILTAAHCSHSITFGQLRYVRLGELDLNSTTDDADPQDFTVKNIYSHPDYKISSKYHDIALVQLDRPVKLTSYVKPACLPITTNLTETYPTAMGWGLIEDGGHPANILQVGSMKYVSNERCRQIYGTPAGLKDGIVEQLLICAEGDTARRDTCHGDSGGPLQIQNFWYEFNSFPEIVGITSFGKRCGLAADVYTRVDHYLLWIEQIIWKNE